CVAITTAPNTTTLSDEIIQSDSNATLSDNNNLLKCRVFDDSKIAKLNDIRSQGLNPSPYRFEKNGDIWEILKKFDDFEKNEGLKVRTAGRLYKFGNLEK